MASTAAERVMLRNIAQRTQGRTNRRPEPPRVPGDVVHLSRDTPAAKKWHDLIASYLPR